jgi:adenylate cyclase
MTSSDNTRRAFLRGVWLAGGLVAVLVLALSGTRAFEWLESGTYDARVRWSAQPEKVDPRIVIIDIDNPSLDVLQDKLGRWPWTRRVWTEVVRYVSQGKPKVVAMDVIFGGNESAQVDGEFARVMKTAGNVVIGFSFLSSNLTASDDTGPDKQAAEAKARSLEAWSLPPGLGEEFEAEDFSPNAPLPTLMQAAAGLGCLNSAPDKDGNIRRVTLHAKYRGRAYPSLSAKTVDVAAGNVQGLTWHARQGWFDSSYAQLLGKSVPVDDEGRMLLLWHGNRSVYPRLPIWQVICSIYRDQCPNNKNVYEPEYFKDKIVLIGASAAASYDHHPTPFEEAAPGFMAHATAVDNLLNGQAMRPPPRWVLVAVVLLMVLAGMELQIRLKSMSWGVGVLLAAVAVYGVVAVGLFRNAHFVLPVVAPVLALALTYGSSTAVRYITTGRELRRTRGMLDRYIAPQLVDYVMSHIETINLKGDKRELTILMSDVRNFTTMTEKSDPVELIALLDDYLAAMTEIIFRHNGIVDKFIGDGILAYWGAFTPELNHAEEASRAALEMLERLEQLNQQWAAQGKSPIAIGIGVNTGTVIFGNIGRGKKIEFTVIGDAVNLAARLESLNKEFGTHAIISDETRKRLGPTAQVRALGGVKVKGKTIETTVFELLALGGAAATVEEEVPSKAGA